MSAWRARTVAGLAVLAWAGCTPAIFPHSQIRMADDPAAAEVRVFHAPVSGNLPLDSATVLLDDERLMRLRRGTFARVFIEPGRHRVAIRVAGFGNAVGQGRGEVEFSPGRSHDLLVAWPRGGQPRVSDAGAEEADRLARELSPVGAIALDPRRFPPHSRGAVRSSHGWQEQGARPPPMPPPRR